MKCSPRSSGVSMDLHYYWRQGTNLPQHTNNMESSPSALDLWEITELNTPSKAAIA